MVSIPASDLNLSPCFFLFSNFQGKLLEMKSTWSPGPISHTQASLSQELWKVSPGTRNSNAPSRPPPGLTNTKPSSTWGGNSLGVSQGWNSSYSSGKFSIYAARVDQSSKTNNLEHLDPSLSLSSFMLSLVFQMGTSQEFNGKYTDLSVFFLF